MKDPRISRAEPRPDYTVRIVWTDGTESVVDLKPWIDRGGIFAPLREPAFFMRMMHVAWDGYFLGWPGEIDFSAAGLWQTAHGQAAAE